MQQYTRSVTRFMHLASYDYVIRRRCDCAGNARDAPHTYKELALRLICTHACIRTVVCNVLETNMCRQRNYSEFIPYRNYSLCLNIMFRYNNKRMLKNKLSFVTALYWIEHTIRSYLFGSQLQSLNEKLSFVWLCNGLHTIKLSNRHGSNLA